MSARNVVLALLVAALWVAAGAEAQRDPIPYDAPEVIVFGADRFVLPDPKDYRVELGDGLVAFMAEDSNISVMDATRATSSKPKPVNKIHVTVIRP